MLHNDHVKQKKVAAYLKTLAVRMLRPLLSDNVFSKESNNVRLVASLPAHRNVLREHILRPGVTLSSLYDLTLKEYVRWGKLERTGAQYVLLSLAKGLDHLHKNGIGHFDVKPSNILVNINVCVSTYTYTFTHIYIHM